MGRIVCFGYGLACYLVFLLTCLYFAGFLGNELVPKGIDSGTPGSFGGALATDALLLGLVAVQHSVMARDWFKRWWTRFVPEPVERSTYVLFSCLVLLLVFAVWQPMTGVVWSIENPAGRVAVSVLYWAGWAVVVVGSFFIDHFELFGLRQVYSHLRRRDRTEVRFATPAWYRLVRHPIMLGYLVAFWASPRMTVGHVVFAGGMTVYTLIGLHFEERDLIRDHGAAYEQYRRTVPMLLPIPRRRQEARNVRGALTTFLVAAGLLVSRASVASDPRSVGTAELHSMMMDNAYRLEGGKKTPFTIIDARSREAYAVSHVFSAISVPEEDIRHANLLPEDRSALLVVYGDEASPRTALEWAKKASAAGYTNIAVYAEPFAEWKDKHMPVAP